MIDPEDIAERGVRADTHTVAVATLVAILQLRDEIRALRGEMKAPRRRRAAKKAD